MRAIRSFQCGVGLRVNINAGVGAQLAFYNTWASLQQHRYAHTQALSGSGKPTNFSPEGVVVKSIFHVPELADTKTHAQTRMSLPQFMLQRIASHNQSHTALIDGCNKLTLTYGELHANTFTLGHVLKGIEGLSASSVIGVMSPNHINYFMTIWAAGLNEYVATPINHLYTEEEVTFQLTHTRAKVIVAHTVCLERAAKVAAELGIKHVIVINGDTHPTHPTINSLINQRRANLLSQGKQDNNSVFRGTGKPGDGFDSNSNFILPCSSGTTGTPKAVCLSHRNIISNCLQTIVFDGKSMGPDEQGNQRANICPLPYFHIYGNLVHNIALYSGSKHIFMMGFDLVRFLDLIQEHQVSKAFVVPPVVLALAKHPIIDTYNLKSLKCLLSGAAPLGAEVMELCEKRLHVLIKQGWGMTELSPLGSGAPDEYVMRHDWALDEVRKGASGMVPAEAEAKVVDVLTGADLKHTETGEICMRGPMVMNGYFENETATKNMIDKDGWLHTGDVGHISETGFFFITDRCKELIKYKGFQVPPAELEAIIAGMAGVKDCVVIPVPCPEGGEIPRAYVVKQDDPQSQQLTAKEIEDYVKAKVAPHKRLRGGVRFQDVIPKSPSGKILRRVQVEMDRKLNAASPANQ